MTYKEAVWIDASRAATKKTIAELNETIDTLTAQNGALLTEIAILKGDMRPASVASDA
jgi:hypothetical protein